jgi:hypothetical protein
MSAKKAVFGILRDRAQAEQVLLDLNRTRFRMQDVSALLPTREPTSDVAHAQGTRAPGASPAVGGTPLFGAGSPLGLLAGLGTLPMPGHAGPTLAAGPVLTALRGVTAGSMAGELKKLGIAAARAEIYENKVRDGSMLVGIHAMNGRQADEVQRILARQRATDVGTYDDLVGSPQSEPVQSTPVAR